MKKWLTCVVNLDLLYYLSTIKNKAGYRKSSYTINSKETYALARFCRPSCKIMLDLTTPVSLPFSP